MKNGKRLIVFIFTILIMAGTFVTSSEAQSRISVRRSSQRPVAVRRVYYYDPFWRYNYWGYNGFYDPYWSNPYLRYEEQKYYLEKGVRDDRRELQKHREKYGSDGVITAKEQKELDDNYKDLRKSTERLNRFYRNN